MLSKMPFTSIMNPVTLTVVDSIIGRRNRRRFPFLRLDFWAFLKPEVSCVQCLY